MIACFPNFAIAFRCSVPGLFSLLASAWQLVRLLSSARGLVAALIVAENKFSCSKDGFFTTGREMYVFFFLPPNMHWRLRGGVGDRHRLKLLQTQTWLACFDCQTKLHIN